MTSDDVNRALSLVQQHPNLSRGALQGAIALQLGDAEVQEIAKRDTGNWFTGAVGAATDLVAEGADLAWEQAIKPLVRGAFLVADSAAQELVQRPLVAASAAAFGDADSFGEAYRDYGDSALVNIAQGDLLRTDELGNEIEGGSLGTGFFAGGQAQASSDAERVLQINGHRANFGNAMPLSRGIGALVGYDSTAHNFVAGVTQFVADVGLDPLAIVTGGSSTAARAAARAGVISDTGRAFDVIEGGVQGVRSRARALNAGDAAEVIEEVGREVGLFTALGRQGAMVDRATSLVGDERVINALAERSSYDIWRSFNRSAGRNGITAKTLQRLKTNDPSEVADITIDQIALNQWTEKGFLSGLRRFRSGDRIGERFRGYAPSRRISDGDIDGTIQTVDSLLTGARVPYEQRERIFNRFLDLTDEGIEPLDRVTAYREIYDDALQQVVDAVVGEFDITDTTGQAIIKRAGELSAEDLTKAQDAVRARLGTAVKAASEDAALAREFSATSQGVVQLPNSKVTINADGSRTIGQAPMLLTQLADEAAYAVPDINMVRRAAGRLAKTENVYLQKGWEFTDHVSRHLTRDIFKPAAILRPAYVVRIGIEEQFRLAASGLDSVFTHPFRFIMHNIVARRAMPEGEDVGRLRGKLNETNEFLRRLYGIDDVDRELSTALDSKGNPVPGRPMEEVGLELKAVNNRAYNTLDPEEARQTMMNRWDMAPKPPVPDERWMDYWRRNLNQFAGDPAARMIARLGGLDQDAMVLWARQSEAGKRWVELMSRTNDNAASIRVDDNELKRWFHGVHVALTDATGGVVRETSHNGLFTVQQHGNSDLLQQIADGRIGRNLDNYFDVAPKSVRYEESLYEQMPRPEKHYLDQALNWMFDTLTGKPTNALARYPAFRQFYIKAAGDAMDALATDDLRREMAQQLDTMFTLTKKERQTIARRAGQSSNSPGVFDNIEDFDDMLKVRAADQTKALLFDVTKRSNAQQALEVVFPFLDAWEEVTSTWARIARENPAFFLRAGQGLESARDQGVVYANEFGEEVFAYPGGGVLSNFFPGDNASLRLEGRLQGANIVAQGVGPGFGPIVQWGVGAFLSKDEDLQMLREWLAPFGTGGIESASDLADPSSFLDTLMPAWFRKASNAFTGGGIDEVQFNSTMGDVMKVLAMSGEYQPGDENDQQRLLRDASRGARFILFLRSATQAAAITGASAKFELEADVDADAIPTDWDPEVDPDGKFHTLGVLANEYRRLAEHYNYDFEIATAKFIDIFGIEPYYVSQAKTRSISDLPVDEQGHNWIRAHRDAADRHQGVVGFFVPPEADAELDYAIYRDQISRGDRQSLTAKQQLQLANQTKARQIYNRVKAQVAPLPKSQRDSTLAMVAADLEDQFPGWREPVLGVDAKLSSNQKITRLQRAVEDADLQDSPVTQPLRTYFQVREQMLAVIRDRSGSATATLGRKAAADLRAALLLVGNDLQQSSPAFAGVWTRVLKQEVEENG